MALMPIDNGANAYPFSRESTYVNAPGESGVYVIHSERACLYVGESNNIQLRLLEHIADTNGCVMQHMPFMFTFELADAGTRVSRRNELVANLHPLCNPSL